MRSARWLLAGAVFTAVAPGPAVGQGAAAWRDSAQRFHALASALRDSMVRGDSTTEEVARRGNFAIAASPKDQTVAAEALQRFAEVSDHWFGGMMPSAGGFRIVVNTEIRTGRGYGSPRELGAVVLSGLPDIDSVTRVHYNSTPGDVAETLINSYGAMMFTSTAATALWLGSPPPLSAPEARRRQVAMYALVTGSGRAQRACAGGILPACGSAFGLDQSVDADIGPMFSVFMRSDLLFTALSVGGRGAWSRFVSAANVGIEPALVAAAAMPLDSLLARWRGGLLALRPIQGPMTPPVALAALCWSAAFLAGAIGAARWA